MVRTFPVLLNAAHPELPLFEASAIVGSASTAFIRNVPRAVGSWHISKVYVSADYPDGSNVVVEATVGAEGVYTATLPATNFSGRTRCGFQVLADGIDENNEPVTGYMLGIADFAVYTRSLTIDPGTINYIVHYFDNAPQHPKVGDMAPIDGVLQFYNGTAWIDFANVDLANYYTKTETDAAIQNATTGLYTKPADGIPKTDLAAAVQASLDKADAALPKTDVIDPVTATETGKAADALKVKERIALNNRGFNGSGYSDWNYSPDWVLVLDSSMRFDRVVYNEGYWIAQGHPDGIASEIIISQVQGAESALTVTFPTSEYLSGQVVATRTALKGYVMGDPADNTNPNKDKPVAKQEDLTAAEQAIAAKYTKPNDGIPKTDLASGVQTSLDKADAALPGTGGTMTGGLTTPNLTVGVRYAGSAVAKNSVAAGGENEASGDYSFANGGNTHAKGHFSHAEGVNTEATGAYQHAEGSYNDPHTVLSGTAEQIAAGTALWMLGFGTSSSDKKNAVETMRNGKTFIYGVGGYDGTNPTGSGVVDIASFLNALPSAGDIRYTIGTATTISSASTDDTDPQNPIDYGAVTLADRTANVVAVTAALDELRITFPAAVSGKVRDTYLRVEVGTGSAALTAPAIVPVAPTGETITIEAADGTLPTLADGSASSKGITLLYFTETKAGTFLMQGKTIEEVA